jgi:outer membrane protein
MKRFILSILLYTGFLVSIFAQATITRFAVVDMNRVTAAFVDQLPEAKAFNEKREKFEAEIKKQSQELEELNVKLAEAHGQEKKDQSKIRSLENQIKSKEQSIKTYVERTYAELERDRKKKKKNDTLMNQISNVIRLVAESEGYSMVLNKADNAGILWSSPSVDITNKVIERIRSGSSRR